MMPARYPRIGCLSENIIDTQRIRQLKLNPKESIVMSKYDESQIQEDEVVIDLGVLFSDMWR